MLFHKIEFSKMVNIYKLLTRKINQNAQLHFKLFGILIAINFILFFHFYI